MINDFAASNNNTFTKCPSTTVNNTSPNGSSSTSTNAPNTGAIVGGAVGGAAALAIAIGVFFLWRRHRQNSGPKPLDLSAEYDENRYVAPPAASPAMRTAKAVPGAVAPISE